MTLAVVSSLSISLFCGLTAWFESGEAKRFAFELSLFVGRGLGEGTVRASRIGGRAFSEASVVTGAGVAISVNGGVTQNTCWTTRTYDVAGIVGKRDGLGACQKEPSLAAVFTVLRHLL
jgi:hypothetical protein